MNAADVRYNGFLDNLNDDWIATDGAGTPIARASTEDALRRGNPNAAAIFSAADLRKAGVIPGNDPAKPWAPEGLGMDPIGVPASIIREIVGITAAASRPTAVDTSVAQNPPAKDPLDHDGNGRRGGAKPPKPSRHVAEKTAAAPAPKGKAKR